MSKPTIIEATPIHLAELKATLETIQKRDGELSFRGGKTMEYLNDCDVLPLDKANELFEKIKALDIPRLQDKHIIKIINTLPVTGKEVQAVLQGYTVSVTKENQEKIAQAVAEYV
ncbi:hypothetical protein D6774_04895 [Candidatus Woesearchaeota archaeon]|nr:MAG: hypothetical protein D6774_04895 [Candidatus Woesearchaeota archaeon]